MADMVDLAIFARKVLQIATRKTTTTTREWLANMRYVLKEMENENTIRLAVGNNDVLSRKTFPIPTKLSLPSWKKSLE